MVGTGGGEGEAGGKTIDVLNGLRAKRRPGLDGSQARGWRYERKGQGYKRERRRFGCNQHIIWRGKQKEEIIDSRGEIHRRNSKGP